MSRDEGVSCRPSKILHLEVLADRRLTAAVGSVTGRAPGFVDCRAVGKHQHRQSERQQQGACECLFHRAATFFRSSILQDRSLRQTDRGTAPGRQQSCPYSASPRRSAPWYRSHVAVTDTSPEAAAVQLELYRALGPSGRAQIAVDLSDAVRETALAGIRRRHPEYSDDEVSRAFLTLLYGLAKKPLER